MLKSFMKSRPVTDQSEQFMVLAMVNGRGMDAADFVAITSLTAASGDANKTMNIRMPSFPTISAAVLREKFDSMKPFRKTIHVTTNMCCFTVPGSELEPGGVYFLNSLK